MKITRSSKKFIRRWASYPLRSLMYRHSKKIILILLAVIAFLAVMVLKPEAAETLPEMNTQALGEVAAAISENAAVVQSFADGINVTEVVSMMEGMREFMDAPFGGAPGIVMVVLLFVMVFIVLRKVLGR